MPFKVDNSGSGNWPLNRLSGLFATLSGVSLLVNGLSRLRSRKPFWSWFQLFGATLLTVAGLAYFINDRGRTPVAEKKSNASVLPDITPASDSEPIGEPNLNNQSVGPVVEPPSPPTLPAPDYLPPLANDTTAKLVAPGLTLVRRISGFVFISAALTLAYLAQVYLNGARVGEFGYQFLSQNVTFLDLEVRQVLAGFGYILAIYMWLVSGYWLTPTTRQPVSQVQVPVAKKKTISPKMVLPLLGLAVSAFGMVRYSISGEDTLVRWTWLLGVVITFAGLLWVYGYRGGEQSEASPAFTGRNLAILVVILGIGGALRFYALDTIPEDLHPDVAIEGIKARDILSGRQTNISGDSYAGLSWISMEPYAISMKAVGDTIIGLQLPNVIPGFLAVLGTYLLVWRLFDQHWIAAVAAATVATNATHIFFSHSNVMPPVTFDIFSLWLFIDGLRGRRVISLAGAGSLAALAILNYNAGRIIVPIFFALVVYCLLFRRRWLFDNVGGLAWMAATLVATMGPDFVFYYLQNLSAFTSRAQTIFIFSPGTTAVTEQGLGVSTVQDLVIAQLKRSIFAMNYYDNTSSHFVFDHNMINVFISPFLFLGLGSAVRQFRKPGMFAVLASMGLVLFLGSFLVAGAPSWPRLVLLIPLAGALIGVAVVDLGQRLVWIFSPGIPAQTLKLILLAGAIIFFAELGQYEWTLYSDTVAHNGLVPSRIGRYLGSLPLEVAACDFVGDYKLNIFELRMLAGQRQLVDLPPDSKPEQLSLCPKSKVVWIFYANTLDHLQMIEAAWPNGTTEQHADRDGKLGFTTYLVP